MDLFIQIFIGVLFFAIGIVFASFSNVLIYRLPLEQSIAYPASHCPQCGAELKWYENIPLFSYIFLKGKCGHCHQKISPRYFIVELLGGLLSLACYLKLGFGVDSVIGAISVIILVAIAFIDAEHKIIPLSLNITLGVLATLKLVLNIIFTPNYPWVHYLIGFGVFAVLFLAVYFLAILFYKQEGLGLGDVILMSICGLYLNWSGAFIVFLASSVICAIVMIILIAIKKLKRNEEWGFGPYIAIAFVIMIYFSNDLLSYILSFLS